MDNKTDNIIVKRKPGRPKKTENTLPAAEPVKKGRGRPKGTKNKTIRKDKDIQPTAPGKNRKAMLFSVALSTLPYIDVNNPLQVRNIVSQYFDICSQFDLKPTIAARAMAFHVDRATLFNWLNHNTRTIKNTECFDTIKQAYNQITLLYETYLTDGSIIPVSGFFLMKNNMGYKDTTDYIINTNQEKEDNPGDIFNRAGLLD